MQIAKLSQYEEKISSLQEEKISLEKQLSLSHSTMTQLQQQNSSLVAELGEPQRKLLQLHEAGFLTFIISGVSYVKSPSFMWLAVIFILTVIVLSA
jgi:septal ring factor EnvC (AmiA/AmiB activator)